MCVLSCCSMILGLTYTGYPGKWSHQIDLITIPWRCAWSFFTRFLPFMLWNGTHVKTCGVFVTRQNSFALRNVSFPRRLHPSGCHGIDTDPGYGTFVPWCSIITKISWAGLPWVGRSWWNPHSDPVHWWADAIFWNYLGHIGVYFEVYFFPFCIFCYCPMTQFDPISLQEELFASTSWSGLSKHRQLTGSKTCPWQR